MPLPVKIVQLRLDGNAHETYVLQTSSNLGNWDPWLTNTPLSGVSLMTDASVTTQAQRFYRTMSAP